MKRPWGALGQAGQKVLQDCAGGLTPDFGGPLEGAPFLHQGDLDGLVAQGAQAQAARALGIFPVVSGYAPETGLDQLGPNVLLAMVLERIGGLEQDAGTGFRPFCWSGAGSCIRRIRSSSILAARLNRLFEPRWTPWWTYAVRTVSLDTMPIWVRSCRADLMPGRFRSVWPISSSVDIPASGAAFISRRVMFRSWRL